MNSQYGCNVNQCHLSAQRECYLSPRSLSAPSCDGMTCQSSVHWWPTTIASRSAQKNVAVSVLKPPPALEAGKSAVCSPRRPDKLISSLSWAGPERCVVLHHRCGHCHFRFACCCGEMKSLRLGPWISLPVLLCLPSIPRRHFAQGRPLRRSRFVAVQFTPTGADSAGVL